LHQVSSHPGLEILELRTRQPTAELHGHVEQTLALVFVQSTLFSWWVLLPIQHVEFQGQMQGERQLSSKV
jgi:hypothetical protein